MDTQCRFSIGLLLFFLICWFGSTTNAKNSERKRDAKHLLLNLVPVPPPVYNPEPSPLMAVNPNSNDYYESDKPWNSRQIFGVGNLVLGGYPDMFGASPQQCPACPSSPPCPSCDTKPPCAAAAIPAAPFIISAASSCVTPATMIKCARVTAAPSGVFSVTFDTAIPLLASATASLGIATTYPNTQVRVTCGPIPANVFVLTQSGPVAYPPTSPTVTETGAYVHLLVFATQLALPGATVTCSWFAS